MLPNFLGIGVQRAATTWLHNCLQEHPEVFVPEQKEIHFFSRHYDRGADWYERFFEGATGCKAIGEITPTYFHEARLDRIAEILPTARLIVTLRHPVDRAFSAYCLFKDQFTSSFDELCGKSASYLTTHSLYAEKLEQLFSLFRRSQIKILLYDDIDSHPGQVLQEVFEFLDVDADFVPPSLAKTFNRVLFPRTQKLVSRMKLTWTLDLVKRTRFGEWLKTSSRRANGVRGADGSPGQRPLLRDFFRDDILRVQDLIGRDLSHWI